MARLDQEALQKRSRDRWLPAVSSPDDLLDVATLISDLNAAHGARSNDPDGCTLIARILLSRFEAKLIFGRANAWAQSADIKKSVGFNGSIGVGDLSEDLAEHERLGKEWSKMVEREREADEWARKRAGQ